MTIKDLMTLLDKLNIEYNNEYDLVLFIKGDIQNRVVARMMKYIEGLAIAKERREENFCADFYSVIDVYRFKTFEVRKMVGIRYYLNENF